MSELQGASPNAESSEKFCAELLEAVELAFHEFYGSRWSPAIQQLYQETGSVCLVIARRLDPGMAEPARPVAHSRVLTNYRDRNL